MNQNSGEVKIILAAAVLLLAAGGLGAEGLSGRAVLEKTLARDYQDLTLTIHLVKTAKSGKERPMDLTVKMKQYPEVKKTLAVFTGPAEVAGIASLSYDYTDPNKEAERWFKLSGMEYVKCLGQACSNMEERFGFSTEIFAINLEDAEHKLLGEETVDGAACYKVESVAKDPANGEGAKFITWVDKDKFAARKIEAYDQAGKLAQRSSFTEFKQINGRWWETKGHLDQFETGKKLDFEIRDAKVNTGIPDQEFEKPKTFAVQGDDK
jgi:hypothetical protein